MATMPIYQTNYPRQQEELHEEAHVQAWLEAIAAQGFYLAQRTESFFDRWMEALVAHSLTPGLSPFARETARAFCAGERLGCEAYSCAEAFQVSLNPSYSQGSVVLSVDDGLFSVGKERQQHYEQFLDLVELTYRQWHPIYGFDYSPAPGLPDTTREQALALEIPCLYRINLFGPELVEKLGGREHVLKTPAWQVKALDDGGILVATIPYVEPELEKVTPYSYQAAARHLGLPEPQIRFPDRSQFSRG